MTPTDLTIKILEQIRDGVLETNARVDQTNARLAETNARLDRTRDELCGEVRALADRVTGMDHRLSSGLAALQGTVEDVKVLIKGHFDMSGRLDRCEQDISRLKRHTGLG